MVRTSILGFMKAAFVAGVGAVAVVACSSNTGSGSGSNNTATPGDDAGSPAADAGPTVSPTLLMAHNDWLSANLNDQIAKILLEEHLGVQVTFVPETTAGQWEALRSGDVHVSLEMWPSGHPDDIQKYMADGSDHTVENAGPLGPIAKVGWFIPTYLLTAHPELATWEGYKDPNNVTLFQSVQTGSKGRFLGGDPSWVAYDQYIIDNLGLNFQVVNSGSEAATIAELDTAYSKRAPILFYLWTPHWVLAKYDLTMVTLPPYNDAAWNSGSKVNCDYPADHLTKIMWPGLKDSSPVAYDFLKKMSYTTKDQITMMASVQSKSLTVDAAAREWLAANETVWRTWLPAGTK